MLNICAFVVQTEPQTRIWTRTVALVSESCTLYAGHHPNHFLVTLLQHLNRILFSMFSEHNPGKDHIYFRNIFVVNTSNFWETGLLHQVLNEISGFSAAKTWIMFNRQVLILLFADDQEQYIRALQFFHSSYHVMNSQ